MDPKFNSMTKYLTTKSGSDDCFSNSFTMTRNYSEGSKVQFSIKDNVFISSFSHPIEYIDLFCQIVIGL